MEQRNTTVLIVEDEYVNRQILKRIIINEGYGVVEAENGKDALDKLYEFKDELCAILLDIIMPVMNGYEFLEKLSKTEYNNLPVIVMTGEQNQETEQKALDAGAWDFVTKPYRPKTLIIRLKNAVARSQVRYLAQIRHMAEHDTLTDLYNRKHFFETTRKMIDKHPELEFSMIRIDIDRFRVLNSFWGEQGGNRFLIFISETIKLYAETEMCCTYGRIESDIFCVCAPFSSKEDQVNKLDNLISDIVSYNKNYLIQPSVGVYIIKERDLDIDKMYIRASLAAKKCKDQYNEFINYYSESMSEEFVNEQNIVNEMEQALYEKQFEVYLQPKYNLQTGKPYGAEALVRWIHPEKGIISPGVFIPVFEKNGFIGKLDNYIWDKVCALLRKWIDEGKTPTPISVNMSRADLYNPNIVDIMNGLIKKYDLKHSMLNLELTESAYMDNPEIMTARIARLRESGFEIMMDDFGSGYSSLNTLKDIMVDYLKIDMKFLTDKKNDTRSERVLSSVIRMAEWLELPVIVEGVETKDQCRFLESIGCGYIQGYYFAKPMPVTDYEKLVEGVESVPFVSHSDIKPEVIRAIWSSDLKKDFLFNNCPQPFAVFEIDKERISVLRGNKEFVSWFDYNKVQNLGFENFKKTLDNENFNKIKTSFDEAIKTKEVVTCDYIKKLSDRNEIIRLNLKYIGRTESSFVIMGTFVFI